MRISHHIQTVALQFLSTGRVPADCRILKAATDTDYPEGVIRVVVGDGRSVIVKLWNCQRIRARLKRMASRDNARREWRVHRFAMKNRLPVPQAFDFRRLSSAGVADADMMLTEDFPSAVNGLHYFKDLIRQSTETQIATFEDRLIEMTRSFIRVGITDVDHQLNNMLVDADGTVIRIDFECARRYRARRRHQENLGCMLARLICSHVYACQPDVGRTEQFAERIAAELAPASHCLVLAKARVDALLKKQVDLMGIETRLTLPW